MAVENTPITMRLQESEAAMNAAGIPVLGAVVTWEIEENLTLPRAVFTQLREQAGIPDDLEPGKLRDRNKAQRAINTFAKEDKAALRIAKGRRAKDVLALQEETDDHAIYLWTTIESNVDGSAHFPVERRFTYNKNTRSCEASDPDVLITARRDYHVAITQGLPHSFIDELLDKILRLEQEVRETQLRLDTLSAHFADTMTRKDIMAFLGRVVKYANGVGMRRMGGAYIVPAQTLFLVDAMKRFVDSLGNGESYINRPTLYDGRGLATQDDSSAETMLRSWEEHFFGAMEEKREQLKTFRESGRMQDTATLDQEVIDLENLAEQAEMFAQLLGFKVRKYLDVIAKTRDDVTDYARSVAQARSEKKKGK